MNTTKDAADYLWFQRNSSSDDEPMLNVTSLAHVLHVFVNGLLVGSAHGTPTSSIILETKVSLNNGINNVSLLSVMVGLPDSGPFLEHRTAGLRRVRILSNEDIIDFTNYSWGYQVGLLGEKLQVYTDNGLSEVQWSILSSSTQPPLWYKTKFDAPRGTDPVVLYLGSVGKGEAWVNGQSIGRYWVSFTEPAENPTQTWYNVPRSFLKPVGNLLVLLDEEYGNPLDIVIGTTRITKVCGHVSYSHPPSVTSWKGHYPFSNKKYEKYRGRRPKVQLHCPRKTKISRIIFASLGAPSGDCGSYAIGSCHSSNSRAIVEKNNWLFFMDPDWGSPYIVTVDSLGPQKFGGHLWSQFSSFLDNSLYTSRYSFVPESLALEEAFNCISAATGSLLFWFSGGSNSNITGKLSGNSLASDPRSWKYPAQVKHTTASRHNLAGFSFGSSSKGKSGTPKIFGKILSFTRRQLLNAAEELLSFALVSLPVALVPPFNNLSITAVGAPSESNDMRVQRCMDESPCEVERHGCADLSLPDLNWTRHDVEPRTGIKFPKLLDNILAGGKNANKMSEVLVGTGSRTMKIIKIKSLKVYAFGFYVHPYDVCAKLGPKYASILAGEVNKCHDFYKDLLREDISMTVRLVVNCNGMKINTVRESFEKSLRARLLKTNPDTDFNCLATFGSLFAQDIPLHAGTTIDFRQTADGHLITEIGGNQIGAVHSKELCTAFFDMYIGDVPVSEQSKEEIGRNVANIVRRC